MVITSNAFWRCFAVILGVLGVMGAGVALAFKQRYPEMYRDYKRECEFGNVKPGKLHVWRNLSGDWIINFPTKRHWRNPSRLEDIEAGLRALAEEVQRRNIRSIAVPPLGCGNGGLDWQNVLPCIKAALRPLPNVRVLVFSPE